MWEIILDALKDSAIAMPFLLAIYLFIEFLENNQRAKNKTVRLLNGKLAPLVAGGVGLIPQCGFSVMATDLYCQNYLKLGTLIAFFVATSDEALPILLTNGKTVGVVWIVILVKVVYAVGLGFLLNALDRKALSKDYKLNEVGCCHHDLGHTHEEGQDDHDCEGEHKHSKGAAFWNFVKHPLLHSVKIFVYIFVVNAIFGIILNYAEQAILDFAAGLGFGQCFLTALVGLIPNCAGSVILAGMYTEGIVGLSALLAGLIANSGIALAILFKQRKPKRNLGILFLMYFAGVLMGVVCYFVFPLVGLN